MFCGDECGLQLKPEDVVVVASRVLPGIGMTAPGIGPYYILLEHWERLETSWIAGFPTWERMGGPAPLRTFFE